MGTKTPRQLQRHEAQAAIRSLLRLVAAWELAREKRMSSVAVAADEAVLVRVTDLLAEHEQVGLVATVVRTGKTKQGKTGPSVRYAVRRADVLQLRTHGQLVQALDRLEGGRLQSLGFARAVARTLKPFNPALTQRQVLEATITDEEKDTGVDVLTNPKERAEKLRAWVASEGGRFDAADVLMRKLGRGSGGRKKRSERYGQIVRALLPPSTGLKAPPPLSRLESKFKGGTIGSIALVKAALSALGYNANRVNRAIAGLLRPMPQTSHKVRP